MAKKGICLAVVLATLIVLPRAYSAEETEQDTVERADGRAVSGKIVRDDYLYVVVKDRVETRVESPLVKTVRHADQNDDYALALKARDEKRYTIAAGYFRRALESGKQPWAQEYCNFGIGEAFYESGIFRGYAGRAGNEYFPAAEYLTQALAKNPKSRFMLDIVTMLPVCLAEEGKPADAEAAVKDAGARIRDYKEETQKISARYGVLADRATARLRVAEGRIADIKCHAKKETWENSAAIWKRARLNTEKFPELHVEAVDGMLRAMVNCRDFAAARTEAQAIVDRFNKDNDPAQTPLLPAAHTALGKAQLMQALKLEEKGQKVQANLAFADARWQFLHVISQYFDDEERTAGAHYLAGLCYQKLKNVEVESTDKAVRHWKLVLKNFPRSEFAALAGEALKTAGVPD